jgi:hypothetical protein
MAIEKEKQTYPVYVYHKDYDEPKRCDNKDELRALIDRGWQIKYIYKPYPKWVNGRIVKNKAEHDALKKTMPTIEVIKTDIETGETVKKTTIKGGVKKVET